MSGPPRPVPASAGGRDGDESGTGDHRAQVEALRAEVESLRAREVKLVEAAKVESLGHLMADIAHDLKNSLASIVMGVDYLQKHHPTRDQQTLMILGEIKNAVKKADLVVRRLAGFPSSMDLDLRMEDLNRVVVQVLDLLADAMQDRRVRVETRLEQSLAPVSIDRSKAEQVLLNVLTNSLDLLPRGGTLVVRTAFHEIGERDPLRSQGEARPLEQGSRVALVEVEGQPDPGEGPPTKPPRSSAEGISLRYLIASRLMDLHCGALIVVEGPAGPKAIRLAFRAGSPPRSAAGD